jgi:DNA-directed RNA polymerase subunit E'/Rpb7
MTTVISPYYYRKDYVLPISLLPHQISSNYKDSILKNLRESYEGKCSRDSFIIRIDEITDMGIASIPTKNITSSIEFAKLTAKCYICIPHKNDHIIMKITSIDESLIQMQNGAIKGHCRKTRIGDKFTINKKSFQVFYKDKEIQVGDIVIIEVVTVSCIPKQTNIDVICNLIDMASKKDIENFNKENSMENNSVNDDKFI